MTTGAYATPTSPAWKPGPEAVNAVVGVGEGDSTAAMLFDAWLGGAHAPASNKKAAPAAHRTLFNAMRSLWRSR
jgi:fructose-1-phosphate kinase PfkB-like protein